MNPPRRSDRGTSLIELMLLVVLLGFGGIIVMRHFSNTQSARNSMTGALFRAQIFTFLREVAEHPESIRLSALNNANMRACAVSDFTPGSSSSCLLAQDNLIELYSKGRGVPVAGTPERPVFYKRDGSRCRTAPETCDFVATAGFWPVCRENPLPPGATGCTVTGLAVWVTVEDLRPLVKSYERKVTLSTRELNYALYDARAIVPVAFECTGAERRWDDVTPRIQEGFAGAVSAVGTSSSDWGMACAPGFLRTGCSFFDEKSSWDALEKEVLLTPNGCLTTPYAASSHGTLTIRCCRVR